MNRTRRGEQRICKLAGRRSSARKENLKKSTVHCSSSNSSHGGDQAGRLLLITDHRQQQRQLNASPFIRETPPTPRPLWPQRSLFTPNGSSGGVVVVVYDVLQFCLSVCLPAMLLLLLSTGSSGWFSSSFPLFVPTTNFARLWEFIADNSSSPESFQTRQREREGERDRRTLRSEFLFCALPPPTPKVIILLGGGRCCFRKLTLPPPPSLVFLLFFLFLFCWLCCCWYPQHIHTQFWS